MSEQPMNDKQLENLRTICQKYIANEFSQAAAKAFDPPRAFSRIPKSQQLAVMQGATIEFLAIQVAGIILASENTFTEAGGYDAMFSKLKDYIEEYKTNLKKIMAEDTEPKGDTDGTSVDQEPKAAGQIQE